MSGVRGFTLIELMVGILIGLIVTLAAMSMLADSEGRRRTQTSVTSMDQSGQFTTASIDALVRKAGSGFTQNWQFTFGCRLNAAAGGTTLFPLPATMPAPFSGLAGASMALAPVLIDAGASDGGSDVLVVDSGSAGFGEVPLLFGSVPTASVLSLGGTTTLNANDVLLVADRTASGGALTPCMIEQIAASFASGSAVTQVSLAGTYYLATGTNQALTAYTADGMVVALGNPTAGNPPSFTMLGVGLNNAGGTSTGYNLYSYNLLAANATAVAVTDGVIDFRALYGIDTTGDGQPDTWQSPASGGYDYATLGNGSAASGIKLVKIKQLRVGMIIRTSLVEKANGGGQAVSPASLSMFADTGLTYTRNLSAAEQNYRYRVVETTIPIRNTLLIAQ